MKKLIIVAIVVFAVVIAFNITLLALFLTPPTTEKVVETETPNFAVVVDDDAQECYIVVVLDVIDKSNSIVIITADGDIETAKEEVIFCKTYSEADVWLEIVSGLNG